MYAALQRGGFPVFRGRRRLRGAGLGSLLSSIGLSFGRNILRKLPSIGKRVIKSVGPQILNAAMEGGKDVISGRKKIKRAFKDTVKKHGRKIAKNTASTIERELKKA